MFVKASKIHSHIEEALGTRKTPVKRYTIIIATNLAGKIRYKNQDIKFTTGFYMQTYM